MLPVPTPSNNLTRTSTNGISFSDDSIVNCMLVFIVLSAVRKSGALIKGGGLDSYGR